MASTHHYSKEAERKDDIETHACVVPAWHDWHHVLSFLHSIWHWYCYIPYGFGGIYQFR